MAQRDIYQRKIYAMRRMSLAVIRLSQAMSLAEQDKARRWIKMWGTVSAIHEAKLKNGGYKGGNGRR
ncbi:MAG: hypothetical protein EOP04_08210 [Proteobacteria bacterium]|nr:MAG: hypothetical protein EOP04_08210 [Pseudomonadota bacterium]